MGNFKVAAGVRSLSDATRHFARTMSARSAENPPARALTSAGLERRPGENRPRDCATQARSITRTLPVALTQLPCHRRPLIWVGVTHSAARATFADARVPGARRRSAGASANRETRE